VFEHFSPGLDLAAEAEALRVSGRSDLLTLDDLYPDALPTLQALAQRGYRLALAANQPAPAGDVLAAMAVPFAVIGTSGAWGVAKPDPAFFRRLLDELRLPAAAVAYVGDRVDNDIAPAREVGMPSILIRRGPWAWMPGFAAGAARATAVVDSLTELLALLPPR